MLKQFDRKGAVARRHRRVRTKVKGTATRPRLSVCRSLGHIYAQIVDDVTGRTLASASTVQLKLAKNNVEAAAEVGRAIAASARAAGITRVVFDRGCRPRGRSVVLDAGIDHLMAVRSPSFAGERSEITERVVSLNRVAKVMKGGRRFSFSALIVVGDQNGRVGAGLGKAREVPEAIRKGVEIAKRSMITIPMVGATIPHEVSFKWGAAKILMKPAAPGTGVISGGAMRAVIEASGIKDILTKSLGTNNPINTVRATMEALKSLRTAQEIADLRGRAVEDIVGERLAAAYRSAESRGLIESRSPAGAGAEERKSS
jgi:small subunit ribosomal protein S5